MKDSKSAASVEPLTKCELALYNLEHMLVVSGTVDPDEILTLGLVLVTPSGEQPVRLHPIRLSHPDSSTKTRWHELNSDSLC